MFPRVDNTLKRTHPCGFPSVYTSEKKDTKKLASYTIVLARGASKPNSPGGKARG